MLRRVAISAMLLALLVTGSAVATFAGKYQGFVKGDQATTVGFGIKRTDAGNKRVKNFITDNIVFTCTVGTPGRTDPMEIVGTFPLNEDREFKGKGEAILIGADPFG